jgi:spore coat polysaccharide biosynthesis predicted glycosyltransferase SpsG
MNALVVCHAGVGLGLGHLTRALVVARALHSELGANVYLLIQGDSVQRKDLDEFEHRFLGVEENLLYSITQQLQEMDPNIVVLDLHPRLVPADIGGFLEKLRKGNCKVIGVDSLVKYRSKLDLVFIPSFRYTPPEDLIGATKVLFGWDCFLLNVKRAPIEWKPGRQVLSLTGGSDVTGLGKTLPKLLNESLPDGTELHWVTGAYAPEPVWPVSPRLSMLNDQSPSCLDDLMVEANYAVTIYGVSFFELLYYGVPTVVFSPYGNKDDAELVAIAEQGIALVAKDEVDAVDKLKGLMADNKMAGFLSRQARRRMSALGGQKFAQAVAELLA